ncbi:hypothetical protein M0805_000831 [Coniferiporia weirii]|nr:hypothetical protein M0805_000831 [Coniferiporia weirii]
MKYFISSVSALALVSGASARTFTVTNKCSYTICCESARGPPNGGHSTHGAVQLFTDLNAGTATPDQATGWEAAAGTSVSFSVPDNWTAGRIWPRTECDFSTVQGPTSCATGGCNGGLLCDPHTGTGVPPVTVAEWTLSASGNQDFYDVSLVDGFNVPAAITNTVGCSTASCPVDLNPSCPAALQDKDSSGAVVGCKSACDANVDGDPSDSANCCTGSHNTAATCPSSGVADYSFFKGNCPDSYAYAYDESSGTALWTCDSTKESDYTLTFCP